MNTQKTVYDLDINEVRRNAEKMRSDVLRSMFADLRKRFAGGR
ncbi:MAG: hypothetical protein AAFW64_06255 [Pseudomonadota bacterium]